MKPTMSYAYDVKDLKASDAGLEKIKWAKQSMPVLSTVHDRFSSEHVLKNVKISACLHVTAETANLMLALKAGGAHVRLCASNPLSTQDDVAAALVKKGIPVFAIHGEENETYYRHIEASLVHGPTITMDDGADLVEMVVNNKLALSGEIIGGTEETTTGVRRLRNMEKRGRLPYPIVAVNDAKTKHLFDNRYGTGQSTIDAIIRSTNVLMAGLTVVVCGYGWCGRGIAARAKGMGAQVIVTEVDPISALEAYMDGYRVMPMRDACSRGDVFITATGNKHVISKEHFPSMKDGAILSNAGHFNVEIDVEALKKLSSASRQVRPNVMEYVVEGHRIRLLAEGRLVNLACGEGHPSSVMDMSFANQALSVEFLHIHHRLLEKKVYPVPTAIDREVAQMKLASLGVRIDSDTPEQRMYLESWAEGT